MNIAAFENYLKQTPLVEGAEIDLEVTFTFSGDSTDISGMDIYFTAKENKSDADSSAIFDIKANHNHADASPTTGKTVFEFGSSDLVEGKYYGQFSIYRSNKWVYSDDFQVNIIKRVRESVSS